MPVQSLSTSSSPTQAKPEVLAIVNRSSSVPQLPSNGAADIVEPSDYHIRIQATGDGLDAFFRVFTELARSLSVSDSDNNSSSPPSLRGMPVLPPPSTLVVTAPANRL
ncbi:hypothetical protein PINS_up012290 [Pythium insidiosum]|nr:hypothetical protein PINS_up012290 [Pythium insidiosum]